MLSKEIDPYVEWSFILSVPLEPMEMVELWGYQRGGSPTTVDGTIEPLLSLPELQQRHFDFIARCVAHNLRGVDVVAEAI